MAVLQRWPIATDEAGQCKKTQKAGAFMELLSVNCVADLKGCTVRNIQYQIKHGQIPCKEVRNDKNRPQFLVPLDALDPRLQERYYKQKRGEVLSTAAAPARPVPAKPLDAYSETERSEIDFWIETVNRWQTYRNKPDVKNKAAVDERFVTLMQLENDNLNISIDILYRKWAALRSGNYDGLVDKRGKWKKGRSETPQDIFDVFETYFLDESQHPIERCIEYTQLYLQEKETGASG